MVSGSFRLTADDNWKFFIPWEPGTVAQVSFAADTSLDDTAPPDPNTRPKGTPPQNFRIVMMNEDGSVMHREEVTVGRKPTDKGTKVTYINIDDPANCYGIGVSPGAHGPADQRVGFVLHATKFYK